MNLEFGLPTERASLLTADFSLFYLYFGSAVSGLMYAVSFLSCFALSLYY